MQWGEEERPTGRGVPLQVFERSPKGGCDQLTHFNSSRKDGDFKSDVRKTAFDYRRHGATEENIEIAKRGLIPSRTPPAISPVPSGNEVSSRL